MKRIDTSTRAIDLFGAGKDGYKDGNKGAGIPATDLNASVLNALQEEIANVIEGTGAPLNPADNTQLLQAINSLVKGRADKIVRVASTAAINLAAPGANIDGTAMVAGDTFLEKDNATLADRGIYVWNGAAVPATRDTSADNGAELFGGMIIRVKEGTVNADTNWQITNDGVLTIGVTGITFKLVGASKAISAIQGAFRNLKGSATGTSAVVTYTIDELITGDGAGEYLTTRNWNSTITMTLAGAGGLDTGAVAASTWYYAFAITKDDGTKALIASLSSTTPTLPVGYTKWARIGSFRTDGTANKYPLSFAQKDKVIRYKIATGSNLTTFPQLTSNVNGSLSTPTWIAVGIANFVPPTATEIAVIASSANNGAAIALVPNNNYGPIAVGGGSVANMPQILAASEASGYSRSVSGSILLESTNIYVATSATNNTQSNCFGWTDNI